MKNEYITLLKVDGIYDIQPPVTPPLGSLETFIILLLVLLLVSTVGYLIWKLLYSAKATARNQIKKLRKDFVQNNVNTHDTIYRLCSILRQGLNVKNIDKNTPLPKKLYNNINEWSSFTQNLANSRYKNRKQSQPDMDALFIDSLHWLKLWP